MLREIDEPDEFIPDEEMLASDEFQDLRKQMVAIQPIRHGMIKKYFEKFKWQKKKRDLLLEMLQESEEQVAEILEPSGEFVPFLEAVPEIKTFLAEVEAKEKLNEQKKLAAIAEGSQEGVLKQDKESQIEEVAFDPVKFNPFDMKSIKREEQMEAIKPNQARKVLTVKK